MRASRKYGYSSARDAGRDEALIHDQRIQFAVFAPEAVVAYEPGFVAGYAIYCTTPEEETFTDGVGFSAGDHLASGSSDVFESRLLRHHQHHPARQQDGALIRPVRMKINNWPGDARSRPRLRDGGDDFWKTATVIEMPVRQEDAFDCREINPKPPCIVEPEVGIGADVEEHAMLLFASAAGEQH
jgi:hypothetical protein